MHRLRTNSILKFYHPLAGMKGEKMCLHNIRKWDKHIGHFISDQNYMKYSSMFCFTETHTSVNDFEDIKKYHNGSWESLHEHRGHGLALCYDSNKVEIIKRDFDVVFDYSSFFFKGSICSAYRIPTRCTTGYWKASRAKKSKGGTRSSYFP